MNQKGITIPQIVALVFIAFVIIIVFLIIKSFTNKEEINYVTYQESDKPDILLLGSFVEYVSMNEPYEEKGVVAYTKSGKNISNYVITKIYNNNHIVTAVDTSKFKTYKITYTAVDPDNLSLINTVSRLVIVVDTTAPTITLPKTQTITSFEALSYDLTKGVIVTDNSGNVTFTNDNPLSTAVGKYIVTYKATDASGNVTTRKRIIEVTSGIEIKEENNRVVIDFPSSKNYIYKYSLDSGNTWTECQKHIEIGLNNVIASVYEDDNYVMSVSYNIKNKD